MQKPCAQCAQQFEITDEDLKFYEKVSPVFGGKTCLIPPPTLCPDCRAQRRLAFRNERYLYYRKCDLSGKQILSMYSPDKPYKVYDQKEWWSDKWDPLAYGADYDPTKTFFQQFHDLWLRVPQLSLKNENNQNSDYCSLTANCKNCYLVFESSNNQDCLYGYWLQKCENCLEAGFSHECQYCYEIDNCFNCYNLKWSTNCVNCSDSSFLNDCIGCKNCFMCTNLRQKQYCIKNRQLTKTEYEKQLAEYSTQSREGLTKAKKEFHEFLLKMPHKFRQAVNVTDSSGDYLKDCKECDHCFHAYEAENCKYGEHVWRDSKSNMDVSTVGRHAEMIYESINTAMDAFHNAFCIQCWTGTANLYYCVGCFSCQDCFGCINLRHKKYCILNKQYTKEEYEKLVPQIVAHMSQNKEWGEFLPVSLSEYGYNETVAQEQFPLTKESAQKIGAKWKEKDLINTYQGEVAKVPESITAATDKITKQIFLCGACGKNYKVIDRELEFYKKFNIPLSDLCPNCRHKARMDSRNPNRLYNRACAKCGGKMTTSFAPDKPEIVYCEKCYLKEVY